ncbi:mitochondrial import inner membrane translocase subunit TIM22 [Tanacetum coccineum]
MGSFTFDLSLPTSQPPPGSMGPMASLQSAQTLSSGPPYSSRNFAVIIATTFGSDAVFTLVSSSGAGMAPPNLAVNALSSGLLFALMQGGLFKLGEKLSKPPTATKDVLYTKTRGMLTSLGLHHYEKNFKSGLLTDTTLPLLTDSALRDVKIPPGPRLLIIDHIQRQEFAPSVHGKNAFQSYMGYLEGCSKLLVGVFRCILTLQSLLDSPPGDFPDDLREGVTKSFIAIFSNLRDEGKVLRKLVECINAYLIRDGPNIGGQSLEIHDAVYQFLFRISFSFKGDFSLFIQKVSMASNDPETHGSENVHHCDAVDFYTLI